jgi:Domain of unknown function (DUF222)
MFDQVGSDIAALSDDDVLSGLREMVAVRRAVDSREARLLAEADARGLCDREFGLTTAHWHALEAGLAVETARSRVKVANKLRRLIPGTGAALASGGISWDQARVIADAANPRIADQIAEIETALLDAGRGVGVDRWRREVAGIAALLDQDGGHDPANDIESNRLHLRRGAIGTNLAGTLVGEHALTSEMAIERIADELFRQFTRDHELDPSIAVPSRTTLRALAFAELCRRGLACQLESSRPPVSESVVVITPDDPYHSARDLDATRLSDAMTRTLRCGADVTAIVVDSLGVPLDMGRRVRLATPSQRTALAVRDGGCVFPGCDAPVRWCDAHHMPDWDDGGTTDVAGMAFLCRRHHGIAHRKGWTSGINADGWTWFETPSGTRLDGQRHGRAREGPDVRVA